MICCIPLLTLPSQLDMGARLAEYKIRVQQALLVYQVGIPDKRSAEEALHWDWKEKLPYFFTVLNYLKATHKNIYYVDYSDYLGKNINDFHFSENPEKVSVQVKTITAFKMEDMLDLKNIPPLAQFKMLSPTAQSPTPGYEIFSTVSTDMPWNYAISVNDQGIINGLGIRIVHSKLPRSQLKIINANYNLASVVRSDNEKHVRFYFFNADNPEEIQISTTVDLN